MTGSEPEMEEQTETEINKKLDDYFGALFNGQIPKEPSLETIKKQIDPEKYNPDAYIAEFGRNKVNESTNFSDIVKSKVSKDAYFFLLVNDLIQIRRNYSKNPNKIFHEPTEKYVDIALEALGLERSNEQKQTLRRNLLPQATSFDDELIVQMTNKLIKNYLVSRGSDAPVASGSPGSPRREPKSPDDGRTVLSTLQQIDDFMEESLIRCRISPLKAFKLWQDKILERLPELLSEPEIDWIIAMTINRERIAPSNDFNLESLIEKFNIDETIFRARLNKQIKRQWEITAQVISTEALICVFIQKFSEANNVHHARGIREREFVERELKYCNISWTRDGRAAYEKIKNPDVEVATEVAPAQNPPPLKFDLEASLISAMRTGAKNYERWLDAKTKKNIWITM